MNEMIFLLQVSAILFAIRGARKMGKEAIIALAVLLAVLANFFVLKQIYLLGWSVTCSDAYVIGHLMCLNFLQQKEGKDIAQKTVAISFFALLFFALLAQIHLVYIPSAFDQTQGHYQALLGASSRLLFASLFTFYCVQKLDLFLFARFANLSWKVRSSLSLFISQAVDTLLFTLLGLYGAVEDWVSIFWMSFAVKYLVMAMIILAWKNDEQPYEI